MMIREMKMERFLLNSSYPFLLALPLILLSCHPPGMELIQERERKVREEPERGCIRGMMMLTV